MHSAKLIVIHCNLLLYCACLQCLTVYFVLKLISLKYPKSELLIPYNKTKRSLQNSTTTCVSISYSKKYELRKNIWNPTEVTKFKLWIVWLNESFHAQSDICKFYTYIISSSQLHAYIITKLTMTCKSAWAFIYFALFLNLYFLISTWIANCSKFQDLSN